MFSIRRMNKSRRKWDFGLLPFASVSSPKCGRETGPSAEIGVSLTDVPNLSLSALSKSLSDWLASATYFL